MTSLELNLRLGEVRETVQVTGTAGVINLKSVTTERLVTRDQIERTRWWPSQQQHGRRDAIRAWDL